MGVKENITAHFLLYVVQCLGNLQLVQNVHEKAALLDAYVHNATPTASNRYKTPRKLQK